MALTTYAELCAAVADWLERGDLTSRIPDFIALTESRLNRELKIRTIETTASLTGVAGSRFIALPASFREPQNLWRSPADGRREPLRFITPELMQAETTQGEPLQWGIDGTNIAFERPCDQAYTFALRYLGVLDLATTLTNLVLTEYPDLYLFGACCEAGPFLRDNDLLTIFDTRFKEALAQAKAKESSNKAAVTLSTEPAMLVGRRNRGGFDIESGS